MAKALEKFTPARIEYPWKKWTDGGSYRAAAGVDFTCPPLSFRSILYTHAMRNGLTARVAIKTIDGKEVVDFQFSKKRK